VHTHKASFFGPTQALAESKAMRKLSDVVMSSPRANKAPPANHGDEVRFELF
jgi:hypothetical protein